MTNDASSPVVLLVDDEPELLNAFRLQLSENYQVETAVSAAEADLILGLQKIDLIVADHLMPGENGLDFLMRVKSHFPATKRILVTGYMNPELISRVEVLAGVSACLVKPVARDQLLAAVKAALSA